MSKEELFYLPKSCQDNAVPPRELESGMLEHDSCFCEVRCPHNLESDSGDLLASGEISHITLSIWDSPIWYHTDSSWLACVVFWLSVGHFLWVLGTFPTMQCIADNALKLNCPSLCPMLHYPTPTPTPMVKSPHLTPKINSPLPCRRLSHPSPLPRLDYTPTPINKNTPHPR